MDKNISKKLVIISTLLGLLLLVACEKKEWPTDPPDLTRPLIASTTPEDGSMMNPVNQPITVTFNKEMSLGSLSSLSSVTDGQGNVVDGAWSGSGVTYTYTPKSSWSNSSSYSVDMKGAFTPEGVYIGSGVSDNSGNSLQYETNFSFSTEGNFGNSTIYLGTGGANPGFFAYVQNLELSEFENYPGEGVQTPAISPDGSKVYVASSDNASVVVIDVASNSVSSQIPMPDGVEGPRTLAVTPDGSQVLVACNWTMDLVFINTADNSISATISLADYAEDVHSMAINNAGTRAYITTNWDQGVLVIDIPGQSVLEYIEGVATVESTVAIAVSPDDSKIIVFLAWAEEEIAVIDAAATDNITYMTIGSGGDGWKVDVEGDFIYASGRWNGNIYKINMNDMSYIENNVEWDLTGITVDAEGEVVYSIAPGAGDGEGAIFILNASDLSLLGSIPAGNYRGMVTP